MAREAATITVNPLPELRSFQFSHGRAARWGYHVHAHICFEIIHMTGGAGLAVVGDHDGQFLSGDCYVLAPGLPHSFSTDGFLPGGEVLDMHLLWFMPALVASDQAGEFEAYGPLLARARRGLLVRGEASQALAEALREGTRQADHIDGLVAIHRTLAILNAVPSQTLAAHEASGPFRSQEIARLDAVRQIMRTRFQQPLALGQVAKEAGMSASSLNHLLRKYSRSTFLEHLTALRLEEAKRLLRDGRQGISEIASLAGFGSLATFNRRFRTAEGMSPHEYRERHL